MLKTENMPNLILGLIGIVSSIQAVYAMIKGELLMYDGGGGAKMKSIGGLTGQITHSDFYFYPLLGALFISGLVLGLMTIPKIRSDDVRISKLATWSLLLVLLLWVVIALIIKFS